MLIIPQALLFLTSYSQCSVNINIKCAICSNNPRWIVAKPVNRTKDVIILATVIVACILFLYHFLRTVHWWRRCMWTKWTFTFVTVRALCFYYCCCCCCVVLDLFNFMYHFRLPILIQIPIIFTTWERTTEKKNKLAHICKTRTDGKHLCYSFQSSSIFTNTLPHTCTHAYTYTHTHTHTDRAEKRTNGKV